MPGSVRGTGRDADHVLFLMVDAECLVDGGEQLGGTDLAVDDGPAGRVGLAVDRAAADSTAGERGAPGGGEVVAAQAWVDLRRAAELGERDHQRAFEQSACLEVVEQRRHDVVQLGDHLLMGLEVLPVAVPPGPRHADERDARLDQPAGDQGLLAELRRPELVADRLRLPRDVEQRLAGHQAANALVGHVVAARARVTTARARTACS